MIRVGTRINVRPHARKKQVWGESGAGESGRTTIPSQQQMQELVIIIME